MRKKDILTFEISSPTTPRLLRIIEGAAAGFLRDFGVDEKEGKKIARTLCRNLPKSSGQHGKGTKQEICCLASFAGSSGTLELRFEPEGDFRETAEAARRTFAGSPVISGLKAERGGKRLIIKVKITKDGS